MTRRPGGPELLAMASTAAIAVGNLLAPSVSQAHGDEQALLRFTKNSALTRIGGHKLADPGPELPANLATANQELDSELAQEGPDSCLAAEIGQAMGITSEAGRARFVTPANIDLTRKTTASKNQYPGKTGCDGEEPVKTANPHRQAAAFTVTAKAVPNAKARASLRRGVIRADGENVLFGPAGRLPHSAVSDSIRIDASYGFKQAVQTYANSLQRPGTTLVCADGTTLAGSGNAAALAAAISQAEGRPLIIAGKNMSSLAFQAEFSRQLDAAKRQILAAAGITDPSCKTPGLPPENPDPDETPGAFIPGTVGVDLSWPNCGITPPADAAFGIVGVTGGTVYSTNPCLAAEAAHFDNLSFYLNTGWNDQSSHINPNSPRACGIGDQACLAYNFGYNAALEAVDTVTDTLGADKVATTWAEDLEPTGVNTWSNDAIQNRNSLQGEYDALVASGAVRVILYGTTQAWNDLTGGWQNGWDMWGATSEESAAAAAPYCEGHEFTGGTMVLIQFIGQTGSGETIDKDYVC